MYFVVIINVKFIKVMYICKIDGYLYLVEVLKLNI